MGLTKKELKIPGYELVIQAEEPKCGLRAIVAIHNTVLGPACGGIRRLPYATQEDALKDVLLLSKGMSYKSALAGLDFGGGKSVIIQALDQKTPALLQVFGELVESFDGKYIAAKDMNIDSADLLEVRKGTTHVLGIDGIPGSGGDPSPVTARGIFRALEATVEQISGSKKLTGVTLAIQGIGHVGYRVAELLVEAGAKIWVTDVDLAALDLAREKLGAQVVGLKEIFEIPCDVFVPCALGGVLNQQVIGRLNCKAVCGGANNQLATDADGWRLHEKGILYAPDYAVNAGGIIHIFVEYTGYNRAKALTKADCIYDTLREIFVRAHDKKTAPFVIADKMAEERFQIRSR